MEKFPKYILLLLAVIGYFHIQAQDISNQAEKGNKKHEAVNPPAGDSKIILLTGVQDPSLSKNPAKQPLHPSDPKIGNIDPNSGHNGTAVSKPSDEMQKDPKLNNDGTLPDQKTISAVVDPQKSLTTPIVKNSQEQPAGLLPKNTTNYRDLKGTSAQPAPSQPAKIENYRDTNGPKTQPAPEQPKR